MAKYEKRAFQVKFHDSSVLNFILFFEKSEPFFNSKKNNYYSIQIL